MIRRRLLQLAAIGGLVAGAWLLRRPAVDPAAVQAEAARISAVHGLAIEFGAPATFFVPPHGPQIDGVQVRRARISEVALALPGIERALSAYPPGFVASIIRAVFIAGELSVGGAPAGGTFGPAWIILSAPETLDGDAIRATCLLGLHHELSSFVLRRSPATIVRWAELMSGTASFASGPAESLARDRSPAPDPASGFLSAYGATSFENDFNVYAERIFTEPAEVARLAALHPLVRRKLDALIAAYAAIDPRMIDTFRQLGVG